MTSTNSLFARALLFSLGMLALPIVGLAKPDAPEAFGPESHEDGPANFDRSPRRTLDAVYTISNAVDGNRVLAYSRSPSGVLTSAGDYPTGGKGSGGGLGNQGALALTQDGRWLVTVNAGSDELSVFSVQDEALVLTDIVPSGGKRPISVTVADNLIYVLNAGGAVGSTDNISGFYLSEHGRLYAIPDSTQPLSGASVGPAQISFGLHDDVLIVTEKATSRIDGFVVDDNGRAGPVTSSVSSGATPFGFAISKKGNLFVSEAVSNALSSYQLHSDGSVTSVTKSLVNKQTAACWVVLSKNGKYAYTANAVSNTISGYRIGANGAVTLLNTTGVTAVTDGHPVDMAVSEDGRFLYSLNSTSTTIVGFRLGDDGSLTRISSIGALPAGGTGLVAR